MSSDPFNACLVGLVAGFICNRLIEYALCQAYEEWANYMGKKKRDYHASVMFYQSIQAELNRRAWRRRFLMACRTAWCFILIAFVTILMMILIDHLLTRFAMDFHSGFTVIFCVAGILSGLAETGRNLKMIYQLDQRQRNAAMRAHLTTEADLLRCPEFRLRCSRGQCVCRRIAYGSMSQNQNYPV